MPRCKRHDLEYAGSSNRCPVCNRENVNKYRMNVKAKALEYLGGMCSVCGYKKCEQALEFHHLDPKIKSFSISGQTRRWETVQKELDKCVLLCSNCHRETEYL